MFRSTPEATSAPSADVPADLIPLSVIQLDLDAPAEGWASYLASRDIAITLDDLGRSAISRDAARQLFAEQRAGEVRKAEMRAESEKRAVEADRQWRARLPRGLPWYEVPDGVLPATAMLATAKAEQPRRTPTQNEWLFGEVDDTMVFHPIQGDEAS
jgi:hypothetical protein